MNPDIPMAEADWALFLDFDGTLVEIAETPDSVVVAPHLVATLHALADRLGGALAIVSGRAIADIDARLGACTGWSCASRVAAPWRRLWILRVSIRSARRSAPSPRPMRAC